MLKQCFSTLSYSLSVSIDLNLDLHTTGRECPKVCTNFWHCVTTKRSRVFQTVIVNKQPPSLWEKDNGMSLKRYWPCTWKTHDTLKRMWIVETCFISSKRHMSWILNITLITMIQCINYCVYKIHPYTKVSNNM